MSLLAKIFVVFVTVLCLVYLGVEATVYYHATNWRQQYERAKERHMQWRKLEDQKIADKEAEVTKLKRDVDTADTNVTVLKGQFEAAQSDRKDKASQLEQKTGEYNELQRSHQKVADSIAEKDRQIQQFLADNERLKSELDTANTDKETAQAQVARLTHQLTSTQKENQTLKVDAAEAKQAALDLQLTLEELERAGVPVSTIVLNHRPVPPIRGKVGGVRSDLQPALVILNVGNNKDKVMKGYQFTVYRGSDFIGKVVVEKVMADTCTARVLFTAPGRQIQPNDDAATRLD